MPFGARRTERIMARVTAAGIDALNPHHRFCTPTLISRAHEQNVQVFAWGIRSQRPLERMVGRGADAVYCDNIEAMVSLLRAREDHPAGG
jgi:glycerophosphoryl diester phosphodiesterase